MEAEAEAVEVAKILLLLSSSSSSSSLCPSSPPPATSAPWLDLPDHLTDLILERLPLPDYSRFAFVCRKWRAVHRFHRLRLRSPPRSPPPFIILSGNGGRRGSLSAYSPAESRFYRFQHPNPRRKRCFASFFGWILFIRGPLPDIPPVHVGLSLWNPISGVELDLQSKIVMYHDSEGCHFIVALSARPLDPNCVVLVITDDIFLLRPGEADWIRVQWDNLHSLVNPVSCGGKFYCSTWDLWDLIVIDPAPSPPTVEFYSIGAYDESRGWGAPYFKESLIECNGEVLGLVSNRDNLSNVTGFRVFRVDFCGMKWVKVESLEDYVLIVDRNSSHSVLADDRIGMKGNCVYFPSDLFGTPRSTEGGWPAWKVFDFGTGELTDGYLPESADEYVRHHRSLCWLVPSFEPC